MRPLREGRLNPDAEGGGDGCRSSARGHEAETGKMPDHSENDALALDMIDVHGTEAAGVARANARSAAVAGAIVSAKRWMGVLAAIQRKQAGREAALRADRGEIL